MYSDVSNAKWEERTRPPAPKKHDPNTPAYPEGMEGDRSIYETIHSFIGTEYSNRNKHTHECKQRHLASQLGITLPPLPPQLQQQEGDPNALNNFLARKRSKGEIDQLFHKIVEWIV
ncbi:hypothetical protein BT69DRAFT_1340797 [Atractiella rhizophila]|nr:hypothetical protein BT69DRAFT_1340797 [Atractiella rhizophila]